MTMRVVLCGGDERESWLHRRAYESVREVQLAGVWDPDAERARQRAISWGVQDYAGFSLLLADPEVAAVELLGGLEGRTELALRALVAGKQVIMAGPLARHAAEANQLVKAAACAQAQLVCHEPWLAFPPVAKLQEIIAQRVIGRVSALRMRSLIAGLGGWDPFLNADFPAAEQSLVTIGGDGRFQEVYAKLALAQALLGPIQSVHAFTGRASAPRTTVVSWKHAAHASYGVLELTEAPQLRIRSAYDSRDDNLELTGSAGIAWLAKGPAQLRSEPTLRVFQGENQFAYGNLDDDWQGAYVRALRQAIQAICKPRRSQAALRGAAAIVTKIENLLTEEAGAVLPEVPAYHTASR